MRQYPLRMKERVNITIDEELLARIDEVAEVEHTTRSALVRRVMRGYVETGASVAETRAVYMPDKPTGPAPRTLEEIEPLLRAFFAARSDVAVVWVFGSLARGQTWGGSDVDVAVLPRDESLTSRDRQALREELSYRLADVLGAHVDVAVLGQCSTLLRYRIVCEGVVVYGEGIESAQARMHAISEHLEFKHVIAEADRYWIERVDGYVSI